jgi:hypothetical protein
MKSLSLIFLILASVSSQTSLKFDLFQLKDENRDGKLSHNQFVEGLHLAFSASV